VSREGFTYIGGVENIGASDDVGVENELLPVFQRLAKYPGVEVNDFVTLSVAEKELDSILELTAALWSSDAALEGGNNCNPSISLPSEVFFTTSTRFSMLTSTASTSWELPASS
jgi:hypothetical protein